MSTTATTTTTSCPTWCRHHQNWNAEDGGFHSWEQTGEATGGTWYISLDDDMDGNPAGVDMWLLGTGAQMSSAQARTVAAALIAAADALDSAAVR